MGVLQAALSLGKLYNADIKRLAICALLHDYAKGREEETLDHYSLDKQTILKPVDYAFPAIWHGTISAVLAKEEFKIEDQIILDAIENHTLGHEDPSLELRVLMAADATEPTRNYPGVTEFRMLIRQDLDKGLLMILNAKNKHIEQSGRVAHPRMVETITWLTKR